MNLIVRWLIILTIGFSSASFLFVVEHSGTVEAVCPIGEFPLLVDGEGGNPTTTCVQPVVDSTADSIEEQTSGLQSYIMMFISALSSLAVAFAVLAIVYAGYKYIGSAGNPQEVEEGKNWIIRAGVGLLLVGSIFIIWNFFDSVAAFM